MSSAVWQVVACLSTLLWVGGPSLMAAEKDAKAVPPLPTAEQLLGSVKAPPGWRVTIFGAPPQVNYPTCIDAAPTGEVFVGVDQTGSLGHQPDAGWVLRCIDSDGDGRADRINTFAKMDHPRGLIWDGVNRRLFVLNTPNLSVYYDDNHSGVASRKEDLLTGISTPQFVQERGADHTTNGITMGIDGWIYIAVGDFGFMRCTMSDGKTLANHGGGVARVRPDGTELEMVSINQRNIYGVAVDPLLNIFTRDNTNDGDGWDVRFHHIVPLCNVGYPMLFKHFQEDLLPRLADYGGGAPCGTTYVDEPGYPGGFGTALYTCEWGQQWVSRHPLQPDGATFKVRQERFVQIPHPTDMRVDAQGHMFITSWRNGGFAYDGPNIGFVARVSPEKPGKIPPFPRLDQQTDQELVADLGADSHLLRLNAQQEILRRGDKPGVAERLVRFAASAGNPIAGRVAAIFTLKQLLGASSTPALVKLTEDAGVREWSLKALADRKTQSDRVPAEPFVKALNDDNPRVRVEAVIGLTRLGRKDAAPAILALTDDRDRVVAHIAQRSLIVMHADDACLAALDHAESPSTYDGAVNVLKWFHDSKVVDALIAQLAAAKEPAARKPLLMALARLYYTEAEWDGKWWGTRPTSDGPYYRWVSWSQTDRIGNVLKGQLASADPAMARFLLLELGRNHVDSPEIIKQMAEMAQHDSSFKAAIVDLMSSKRDLNSDALVLLRQIATSPQEEAGLRGKALRTLTSAQGKDALEASVGALAAIGGDAGGELKSARDAFIRDGRLAQQVNYFVSLTSADDPGRRELAYGVLGVIASNNRIPTRGGRRAEAMQQAKQSAATALERAWTNPATAASLLRAIGQTKLDVLADKVRAHLNDPDAGVHEAARYAATALKLDSASSTTARTVTELSYDQVLAAALKAKGDPSVGQQLFLKQGCVACHTVNAEDPPKGPFLGDIASRYTRGEIIESILKPSAKIAQGFQTNWFELKDKDRKEGFVVREGGDEVEIRDITGASTTIKLADVVKRGKSDTSIMPEGLVGNLTVPEFASLLDYLASLKKQ